METAELKDLWQTLANEKLVDKSMAENKIKELITKKGNGYIHKLSRTTRREITIGIINIVVVTTLTIATHIFQVFNRGHDKYHSVLYIFIAFFAFKLYRDVRRYKLLKLSILTQSIKETVQENFTKFKVQIKQDFYAFISFVMAANLFVIFIYFKAFGKPVINDISALSQNGIGFVLFIAVIVYFIASPFLFKYLFKKRYKVIMDDFENTLKELEN